MNIYSMKSLEALDVRFDDLGQVAILLFFSIINNFFSSLYPSKKRRAAADGTSS